jgi:signal transduction histidine kinase
MAPDTGSPISATEATRLGAGPLRRRLALALIGLSVATAVLLAIVNWQVEHWVESESLEKTLESEYSRWMALGGVPMGYADTLFFRPRLGDVVPPVFARLPPGVHPDVMYRGSPYRVLVRELAPDDRAYAAVLLAGHEAREHILVLAFILTALAVGLVSWRLSSLIAARTMAPLEQLVAQLGGLKPDVRGARLPVGSGGELDVIAEALNAYLARIERLVDLERAFSAAASHELRTPLAVISGAAELLAARLPPPQPALERIQRAAEQARLDLEALLALSRQRDLPQPAQLALAVLLPQWAESYVATLGARAPRLSWNLQPRTVLAAPGILRIVFTNLLRNALRAAGGNGEVRVQLDAQGIEIADDGPGIPEEELSQVFELRTRSRDGGSGVGLYIAHALAQRHNWTLQLENRAPRGAVARIRF